MFNENENNQENNNFNLSEQEKTNNVSSFYGSSNYANDSNQYNGYNYSQPEDVYTEASTQSTVTVEAKPVKKKNKSGIGKAVRFTAIAVAFGLVAGGTMTGVNYFAGTYLDEDTTTNVKVPTTQLATAAVSASAASTTSDTDISGVVEAVMPSIVSITSKQMMESGFPFSSEEYESEGAGSGIIIGQNDTELLIVTNNHVVADSDSLSIQFINDKSVDANIKGTDADADLAVVAVPLSEMDADTLNSIKIAKLGSSDSLKVGEKAIAIGNALGYGQSVTTGVISALDREVTVEDVTLNLIQTDAAINPGNSGGALLNTSGEVIGINAAKYSASGVEGMGYAIPISSATDIINNLMNQETKTKVDEAKKGYLGIYGMDVTSSIADTYSIPEGVYVTKVVDDSAADNAGIAQSDVIVEFDGQKVSSMTELQDLLQYYEAGQTVKVKIQYRDGRDYSEKEIDVTLGEAQE